MFSLDPRIAKLLKCRNKKICVFQKLCFTLGKAHLGYFIIVTSSDGEFVHEILVALKF